MCGGVLVNPGDYIVGDPDGVVVTGGSNVLLLDEPHSALDADAVDLVDAIVEIVETGSSLV